MNPAAIVTLAITGVIVLALAWYLIQVIRVLTHVNDQLGKVTFGVRAIAHRTAPIASLVGQIEGDLNDVAGALEQLVGGVSSTTEQAA